MADGGYNAVKHPQHAMPGNPLSSLKKRAEEAVRILSRHYPDARCTLDHRNPFELLCATILAAQCTDAKVNTVTPELFRRWPTPQAMAAADLAEVERVVHPLGFFRQKARALVEMSRDIVAVHGGRVPRTMEELTRLRGVGRKTANVLLGTCFSGGGVIVDTHCRRISRRLGLTRQTDPDRIERELMELLPPEHWSIFGHLMVFHGRAVCDARRPRCEDCPLLHLCPEGKRRTGAAAAAREAAG